MGKNLIALAGKSKLSNGKPVGGKAGRLSRPTIDKLQKYYGNAIRRRVDKAKTKREVDNAVKKMQWAVKAVLYHSVKIDDEKKRHLSTVLAVKALGVPTQETRQTELMLLLSTHHTISIKSS